MAGICKAVTVVLNSILITLDRESDSYERSLRNLFRQTVKEIYIYDASIIIRVVEEKIMSLADAVGFEVQEFDLEMGEKLGYSITDNIMWRKANELFWRSGLRKP